MKRIIAIFLSVVMLLTGCGQTTPQESTSSEGNNAQETIEPAIEPAVEPIEWKDVEPSYTSLDDEQLLAHIEDLVYQDTVVSLDSEEYFVENVSAIYISKEYLDEVAFNSQSNIYFGYTLAELDDIFQGKKYIFTLSDSGTTTVQELQEIEDTSTETMLKNVAIGTGVILVCVTVSAVTAGTGAVAAGTAIAGGATAAGATAGAGAASAPTAVSILFAASAKNAATFAASSAAFGGISAGIVRGIQTEDFSETMQAAAMGATEGFKWGAITGVVATGASYAKSLYALKGVPLNGLTPHQAAAIQLDSKYPLDIIKQFHSIEEYNVYKNAGLKAVMVNGKTALIQNIDLDYVSQLADGTEVTNLRRMQKGLAPLDPKTGTAYQLHHIGQKADGTLAVLTENQHQGNSAILNIVGKESEIDRASFAKTRKEFWEYLGKSVFINGGI